MSACGMWMYGCGARQDAPQAETRKPATPKIVQFYSSAPTIAKGDPSLLCYGVEGAASVRIAPPVEDLAPSVARCFEVKPDITTRYTLFARNAAGDEVSAEVTVTIDPKAKRVAAAAAPRSGPALIEMFMAMQRSVPKGGQATLCYGLKDTVRVALAPAIVPVEVKDRACILVRLEETTKFTLTAFSKSGEKDSETVTVAVQ